MRQREQNLVGDVYKILGWLMSEGVRFTSFFDAAEEASARRFWSRTTQIEKVNENDLIAEDRETVDLSTLNAITRLKYNSARMRVTRENRSLLPVFNLIIKNGKNRKESIWQLSKLMTRRKSGVSMRRRGVATRVTVRRSCKSSAGRNK